MNKNIDIDRVVEAAENDENIGFCLSCGAEHDCCEPDARNYECEECGAHQMFGAAEILLMSF